MYMLHNVSSFLATFVKCLEIVADEPTIFGGHVVKGIDFRTSPRLALHLEPVFVVAFVFRIDVLDILIPLPGFLLAGIL